MIIKKLFYWYSKFIHVTGITNLSSRTSSITQLGSCIRNTIRWNYVTLTNWKICQRVWSEPSKTSECLRYVKFKIIASSKFGYVCRHGKPHSRDYLKKKKQKKQQRYKQIEEERESEKNKWLSFSSKSTKKSGVKGKSIFASPDNVNGRVGIGTCGISGKPMTEFSHGEMWRKGT